MTIRTVRRSMLASESLATAEQVSGQPITLCAIALLLGADREGRMLDRPRETIAALLPFYAGSIDAEVAFDVLDRIGFVRRYTATIGGSVVRLVMIQNWARYQVLVTPEPPSELPAPDGSVEAMALAFEAPLIRSGILSETEARAIADPFPSKSCAGYQLSVDTFTRWRDSHPGLDVARELNKARNWLLDNPSKRKTHRGTLPFLSRWLARSFERLPKAVAPAERVEWF